MPSYGLREFQKNQLVFSFTFTPDNPMTAVAPTSGTALGTGPGSATLWTANYGDAANQNMVLASEAFVPNRYRQNGLDNVLWGLHAVNLDGTDAMTTLPKYRVYGRLPGSSLWHNVSQMTTSPVPNPTGAQSAAVGSCAANLGSPSRWNLISVGRISAVALLYPEMYVTLDTIGTYAAASTQRFRFDLYLSE